MERTARLFLEQPVMLPLIMELKENRMSISSSKVHGMKRKLFQLFGRTQEKQKAKAGMEINLRRVFFIPINGIDYRIIVTSYYGFDCRACQQLLSIFSFKKNENFWVLNNESRDAIEEHGYFNDEIASNIDVINIGPSRFGISFTTESWYQGVSYIQKEIYCFVSGELTKVLDGTFQEFFSGIDKDEAIERGWWFEKRIDLKFINSESNFGLFNIEATYTSSKINKKLTVNYKFDGKIYPVIDLNKIDSCKGGMEYVIETKKCI